MAFSASRKGTFRGIPGYGQNAALQLIIATGVAFVAYFFVIVCILAFKAWGVDVRGADKWSAAAFIVEPLVSLPPASGFPAKFWTLFTHGWIAPGFLNWITGAIWIYTWGSMVQMLVGHRQVIPLFVYGLLIGALGYTAVQFIPGIGPVPAFLTGFNAGLMALATAAYTLAPNYRFYFGPNFSIPMIVVALIFAAIQIAGVEGNIPLVCWLLFGALSGFVYVRLLRRGGRPGEWVYTIFERAERSFTPRAERQRPAPVRTIGIPKPARRPGGLSQRRVDELLEKIHTHGYDSLSAEEKEILLRASKEGG